MILVPKNPVIPSFLEPCEWLLAFMYHRGLLEGSIPLSREQYYVLTLVVFII